MNILVTEGENKSALALTRSLGKKGCRVLVAATHASSLASCSRYCFQGLSVPDPLQDGAAYMTAISEISARESIDIIFPMTEQSINLLNAARNSLPGNTILACSPESIMRAVSDKLDLFQLAESLQVPIPQTFYLTNTDDLPAILKQISLYPVVVKPALSRRLVEQVFFSGGVMYAASWKELEHLYTTIPVLRYPSLIQEKIVGPGTGLFTLYDGNRHLALFSHKRLREKPPSGGVSVVSESVSLDEEMVDVADKLLSSVGWRGMAMVEFKRDQRDGKAKLMEINGRFWGSLQLAIACDVDFPSLYLDYLQGKYPPAPIRDYRLGHKMKWFFGTLDHLLIRLKNRDETLNLPSGFPTKWQALMDFIKIWERNTSFDVFSRDDTGPFLLEARSYFRQTVKGKG